MQDVPEVDAERACSVSTATVSVRDMLRTAQSELVRGEVLPARARELLMHCTGLLGFVLEEIIESEVGYNQTLLELLNTNEAANRAKIRAKTTPEYTRLLRAEKAHEFAQELIRSSKVFLRSLDSEMGLSR